MPVHRVTSKMKFKLWYFLLKIAQPSYEFSGKHFQCHLTTSKSLSSLCFSKRRNSMF